jgi:hypothetical protein
MTWVKIDDGFPENPKVVGLSDRAFRVHVRALCYASQHLTDGFIPAAKAKEWGTKHVADLVRAGLWKVCEQPTGYFIHDFLDYNPSREEIESQRRVRSDAGRHAARMRWAKDDAPNTYPHVDAPDPTRPDPTPKPPKAEPPSAVFDQGKWQHLLETLWTHGYVSEGAGALTWKFVMGCMHRYGVPVVDSALSDATLSDAAPLGSSAKYFESICVRFAEGAA